LIKISLIITVYNRSHLIRKSLLSLRNQSVKPDELILSDDGSEEDIVVEIKDITKDFEFPVKYVKQANKGFRLAKTRNNGVRNSKGDLIIFLDQDLIHTTDLLKTFNLNSRDKRFITGMPIWMNEKTSSKITEERIIDNSFNKFITSNDKRYVENQFRKDRRYYYLHKLKLTNQPRLRGGVCAINRKDFELINGYDEKFIGWGAEDDNVGGRLYKSGVEGYNPFLKDYSIHLYHEKAVIPNKGVKEQANYQYYQKKKMEIKKGNYRAEFGLDNPFDEDTFTVIELN